MFDLEVFLYWFCYFDTICTKAIEMPIVYRYYEKAQNATADGMSFREWLSEDGDIFSNSIERQGGMNSIKIEWNSIACAQAPIDVFHSIFCMARSYADFPFTKL